MTHVVEQPDPATLPPGRIDIHSHMLWGIDDGCQLPEESFQCLDMLRDAGFVATICTPHIWPELFPDNIPENITGWTNQLRQRFYEAGSAYQLFPGGEVRLHARVLDWFKRHGVPTLAGTDDVLMDFWEPVWPAWLDPVVDWLLDRGYRPILAHPERIGRQAGLLDNLRRLSDRGVLLQGNCLPFTGAEGPHPVEVMRHLLAEQRYDFLALDMHGPDSLPDRLEGLAMLEQEIGQAEVDRLMSEAPRRLLQHRPARRDSA